MTAMILRLCVQEFRTPEQWEYTAPLIAPEKRGVEPSRAQKKIPRWFSSKAHGTSS
jgi:hypothetical protein